ncbi:MAG: helix-turn-helix transcriptional regulator [Clostridia bacterium]|nr:helix-turn-helix transcriptional regulator [Clostridia bacterium]
MRLDYQEIGRRIAKRRKQLGLTQAQISEMVDISDPYMSSIERAVSIPSTEVIMRLAAALDTTPDAFLVGTARHEGAEAWREVAELLRDLDERQLSAARSFLTWLREQKM